MVEYRGIETGAPAWCAGRRVDHNADRERSSVGGGGLRIRGRTATEGGQKGVRVGTEKGRGVYSVCAWT